MHSEGVVLAQQLLTSLLVIFFAGTIGGKIAGKLNLPDVAIFILIGIILGPEVFGWIQISSSSVLNQLILLFGASFILYHGGTVTEFPVLKKVWRSVSLLSTVGVIITALITGLAVMWIFKIPFFPALLLGAILASTDPAALVPIFQKFPIRKKVAQTVVMESAFTDATGAIMTTVVFGVLVSGAGIGGLEIGGQFFRLAAGGILIGGLVGYVSAFLISEDDRGLLKEFTPMVVVLTVLSAYLLSEWAHASGFMGAFVSGLILGNASSFRLKVLPKEEKAAHAFIDAIGLKLRMLIFVLLGSQVDFQVLKEYGIQGILVALVFMFIARPLTVLFCLLPDRNAQWTWKEVFFFFWTRETGVIAAALTGVIVGAGFPQGKLFMAVTFVIVLITIVLQSATTPALAKKLGLLEKKQ